MSKKYNHVSYLWDDAKAEAMKGNEVDLFIYRSNLLGADLRLTNYGGGNTSVKIQDKDPLTGSETDVMWIKGSGGDIGTLKKSGCAALYMDRFKSLENVYRGLEHEDEMVELFNYCIFDLASKAPSIDTPLHGFLPFKHIDHLHPDAAIAIAAARDGKKITDELFGGQIGWVGWQRPGYDLGLQLRACLSEAASRGVALKGIMLGSHGLFTWADTSYDCYINTLEVIEKCAEYIASKEGVSRPVFGGSKISSLAPEARKAQASALAPILRGFCSSHVQMIGHFSDDERILQYINSNDLDRLAPLGTSCPDHFLRTKISPLVLNLTPDQDLSDLNAIKTQLEPLFIAYRDMYASYHETCKHPNSPAMRDPNPVVILYPGVGMFTFAKDKQTSRVANEFYLNAINVMRGAEAISSYTSLPRQEAFDIEYWLLEEAKLQRMPKPKSLSGRVAFVTGSAGGIGKAIAKKMAQEGACIVLNDVNPDRLAEAKEEFIALFGRDSVTTVIADVTSQPSIEEALKDASLAFGGIDLIVNNAGISISKGILEHTQEDWDRLYDILVKGQYLVSQAAVAIMRKQGLGGDIINIVSKNAFVAGPNNVGYGSAKAAQAHMTRLLAAELGEDQIRVNTVNPDAVIADSNIWAGGWAEGRAKAYGITVAELPAFYAKRTILNKSVLPEDIANACFAFVGGLLGKSTGNALNVDGGVAAGFFKIDMDISSHNESLVGRHKRQLEFLTTEVNVPSGLVQKLKDFQIAIPSWALGTGGTRFGRFSAGGEPRNLEEKIADVGLLHSLNKSSGAISLHIPWDIPSDPKAIMNLASQHGLAFDAVNSNTFQDQPGQALSYKFGSLQHVSKATRKQAIDHNIEVIKQGVSLGSKSLTVWLSDGSCFPGQLNFRKTYQRTVESLEEIYAALPADWKLYLEYKAYEPNFYSTTVGDWGASYSMVNKLGPKAFTLVDLGHHLPNANIEQIVSILLMEGKLGGFHFNDSKYGDDDLTAGSIKPYQLFLIFNELVEGMDARGMNHAKDLGWMIDASHNVKDPLEDLLQSVEAIQIAYAQAILVDQKALEIARDENDVVQCQEILQAAFRTDVRSLVAQARLELGGALDPLAYFRNTNARAKLIETRGEKTQATGL